MQMLQRAGRIAGLLLLVAIASCGGGGGGESGSGGGSPPTGGGGTGPTPTYADVEVSLASPSTLRTSTYEGLPAGEATLHIAYSGDLSVLRGRTIHVKIEQPEPLYVVDAVYLGNGQLVLVRLVGNPAHDLSAGRTQGTLRVRACLDASCSTELRNSPLEVDYDVRVKPGLRLSPDGIQQTSDFGTLPPPRVITVTQPPEAGDWIMFTGSAVPGAHPRSHELVTEWLQQTGNTLTFQPPADLLPGVYAQEFHLQTDVPAGTVPSARNQLMRKFTISHTVLPTGEVYAMTSASATVRASLGDAMVERDMPALYSRVLGAFSVRGVRTDAFPAAAAGHARLPDWLAASVYSPGNPFRFILAYCDASGNDCLPTGTYRGAVLLRHTDRQGVHTDFEFPVTLVLRP